jgi:hypothetical protein
MIKRFVVKSSKEWLERDDVKFFLAALEPDWDEGADPEDPVELVIHESKMALIPNEFDFAHVEVDRTGGGLFGEEGIEVFAPAGELNVGDIVDIEIKVVGNVRFER